VASYFLTIIIAAAAIANGTIIVPELWYDDAGPVAPTDCPTPPAPEIPGFPFLGIAFATMLGVVVLLVTKKRIIPNKHKS